MYKIFDRMSCDRLDLLFRVGLAFIAALIVLALVIGNFGDERGNYAGKLGGEILLPKAADTAGALPHLTDIAKRLRATRLPEPSLIAPGFPARLSAAMFTAADQLTSDTEHFNAKRSSLASYDQALQNSFAAIAVLRKLGHSMSPDGGRQHRIESYLAAVDGLESALSALSPATRNDLTARSNDVRQALGVLPLFDLSVSDALKQLDQYRVYEAVLLKELDRATLARSMAQDIRGDVVLLRAKRASLVKGYQPSLSAQAADNLLDPLILIGAILFVSLNILRFYIRSKSKQGKAAQAAKKPFWVRGLHKGGVVAKIARGDTPVTKPGLPATAKALAVLAPASPLPCLSVKDYHSKTKEHILLMGKYSGSIDHLSGLIDGMSGRCRAFESGLPDTRALETMLAGLLASVPSAAALSFQSREIDMGLSQIGLSLDVDVLDVARGEIQGISMDGMKEAIARIQRGIDDMARFADAISSRAPRQSEALIGMSARVRELSHG